MGDLLADIESASGWWGRSSGEHSPGGFPINSTSLALEFSRPVKSGAGTLFGYSGFNNGGTQYLQFFDETSLPADGAIPKLVAVLVGAANFSGSWGTLGRAFQRGIQVCTSSSIATKTVTSANIWIDVQYW